MPYATIYSTGLVHSRYIQQVICSQVQGGGGYVLEYEAVELGREDHRTCPAVCDNEELQTSHVDVPSDGGRVFGNL